MDAVRFGRALGFGARQAAKTVISAVDAARAENPSRLEPSSTATAVSAPVPPVTSRPISSAPAPVRKTVTPIVAPTSATASRTAKTVVRSATPVRGMQEGISRFKASAVEPVVRLSGVLWLEVVGVFFGIFAFSTAVAIWRLRPEWRPALAHPAAHGGLLTALAVFILFSYFCVSSFVRAKRRERRRG